MFQIIWQCKGLTNCKFEPRGTWSPPHKTAFRGKYIPRQDIIRLGHSNLQFEANKYKPKTVIKISLDQYIRLPHKNEA